MTVAKETRTDCFQPLVWIERGWTLSPSPTPDLQADPTLHVMSHPSWDETPPLIQTIGRKLKCTQTRSERSSCSVSAVCVWGMLMSVQRSSLCLLVRWPQCQLPLSGRLKHCWTVQKLFFLTSYTVFFCQPLFPAPASSLSLCYAHSLLIRSSVGQWGSSEIQECWQLAD